MIKRLEQFRSEADGIQAALNEPVLDGTPFVLVMHDGKNSLVYGELYPDQIGREGVAHKVGFRLQRRFDLCGCFCFDFAKASEHAERMNQEFSGQGLTVIPLHRREWLRGELRQLKSAIELLESSLANLK